MFLPRSARSGSVYYKPSASLFCTPVGVASRTLVVILAATRISVAVLEAGADCPVILGEALPVKLARSSART